MTHAGLAPSNSFILAAMVSEVEVQARVGGTRATVGVA
jgi:hypothetical protein